jgi:5-methylcytosine-specific restriction endonuclease McrA
MRRNKGVNKPQAWKRRARLVLSEQQGGLCWICRQPLTDDDSGPMQTTFDHYVPKAHRGGDGLSNLRLAHQRCNNKRSN